MRSARRALTAALIFGFSSHAVAAEVSDDKAEPRAMQGSTNPGPSAVGSSLGALIGGAIILRRLHEGEGSKKRYRKRPERSAPISRFSPTVPKPKFRPGEFR